MHGIAQTKGRLFGGNLGRIAQHQGQDQGNNICTKGDSKKRGVADVISQ